MENPIFYKFKPLGMEAVMPYPNFGQKWQDHDAQIHCEAANMRSRRNMYVYHLFHEHLLHIAKIERNMGLILEDTACSVRMKWCDFNMRYATYASPDMNIKTNVLNNMIKSDVYEKSSA